MVLSTIFDYGLFLIKLGFASSGQRLNVFGAAK
jgi:hypothetical protein